MITYQGLYSHQLDAVIAFFKSYLKKRVYIEQSERFYNDNPNQVLLMLKYLSRLKQSARLWFDLFGEQSRKIGFVRSDYDHALYLNANGRFITVYVNNIHLIGPDLSLMEEMMSKLSSRFKMTDIGKTSHYLGIGVYRNWDVGIFTVTQTAYID